MVEISKLKVEADIPAKIYMQSDNFTSFSCSPEELIDFQLPLKLQSLRRKSNMNELYKIIFSLDNNSDMKLAPGMVVEVNISVKTDSNKKLTVPVNAVINHDNKTYVWMIKDDNTVNRREVEIGDVFADGTIEIISGLSKNEEIVTAGVNTLIEGQSVKKLEIASQDNVGELL
jgi:RND family efflux transporter MFP subunit